MSNIKVGTSNYMINIVWSILTGVQGGPLLLTVYMVLLFISTTLLGLHTYSVRAFCFGRRVSRLSVNLSVPH